MNNYTLLPIVMLAFAGNSLLGRAGLVGGDISPFAFYAIRIFSGAVVLAILCLIRGQSINLRANIWPALSLSCYAILFTFAYLELAAGLGALILFGAVQFTMFSGGCIKGERPGRFKWLGMFIGLAGLLMIARPGEASAPISYLIMMLLAGIAWGVFSLQGRKTGAPLGTMTASFIISVPIMLALIPFFDTPFAHLGTKGVIMAILSGGVTSGLGYALWYHVLPKLQASTAAIAQLSVPVIAMALGVVLLGESLTGYQLLAAAVILLGIATASLSKN